MIKLSDEEKIILKNIDKRYKWIARGGDGNLFIYREKPIKKESSWVSEMLYDWCGIWIFNHLFLFINWEDKEPYLIEDLLKNNDIAATEIFDLKKVYDCFPQAFVNKEHELIIYPRTNTYFLLKNVENQLQLDCKIIEYCSGEAYDGAKKSKEYHFKGICDYFNKEFTQEEIRLIYMKLGNGINRELCIDYIKSCFDMEVLRK